MSVLGIVSLFLIHWFVFQEHIFSILAILLLKPHWRIFCTTEWELQTIICHFLSSKLPRGASFFVFPIYTSKCIVWHFSSYFTSFATGPLPILLLVKKCVVSVAIAFALIYIAANFNPIPHGGGLMQPPLRFIGHKSQCYWHSDLKFLDFS